MNLTATVTKTSNGQLDYIQIMSEDLSVNVVLLAEKIILKDLRPTK